jgi:hypothetical protein
MSNYDKQITTKNLILADIVKNLTLKEKRDIYGRLRTDQKENYQDCIYKCNPNLLIPKFGITIGEFALFIELNSPSKHSKK